MKRRVSCDYCHGRARCVDGRRVYPDRPELYNKWFWLCERCDAYVGCHPGSIKPLGRLADKQLRQAKQGVHREFDPLWKSGVLTRREAYALLAEMLNMAPQNCHIGMFDLQTCEAAIAALRAKKENSHGRDPQK